MQSQSGSGKTLAFLVGVLQQIDRAYDGCQCIVLLNTFELAVQTVAVFDELTEDMPWATRMECLKGYDVESFRFKFYIGTPGRTLACVTQAVARGELDPARVRFFVIDEADFILDPSKTSTTKSIFQQTYDVYRQLTGAPQTIVVSATISAGLVAMVQKVLGTSYGSILSAPRGSPPASRRRARSRRRSASSS